MEEEKRIFTLDQRLKEPNYKLSIVYQRNCFICKLFYKNLLILERTGNTSANAYDRMSLAVAMDKKIIDVSVANLDALDQLDSLMQDKKTVDGA